MQVSSAPTMQQPPLILPADTTLLEAIRHMSQRHTGCVLVVEQQTLVGICTERDCLQAIATGAKLATTTIATLMTPPITLSASEPLSTVWRVMKQHRVQHLPMVNQAGQVLWVMTERCLLDATDLTAGLPSPDIPALAPAASHPISLDSQQADLAFQPSYQDVSNILASIPAGFYVLDRSWQITYLNQRAAKLLHQTQPELLGQNFWEAFPEVVGTEFDRAYRRAMSEQVNVRFEAVHPLLSTWFEVYAYPAQNKLFVYYQDVTERRCFYDQLQLQAQREQALNQVIQAIRNSLDLSTVFVTATTEIAQLLQADRADIIQYLAEHSVWKIVADSHYTQTLNSISGMEFPDDPNEPIAQLKRLEVVQLEDVAQYPDETVSQYAQLLPGTWLLVPIHFEATLWGCLALIRDRQQHWQATEVELARAVVDQLAIAIQQSQLYQQVQRLNENLESQVQERTLQLRKALDHEALLKRITDRVRDSLDERHILQTTVQELAAELDVLCCDTGLYDPDRSTITICYEAIRSQEFTAMNGAVLALEPLADTYQQILQGQWVHYCPLFDLEDASRPIRYKCTLLVCPLMDNDGILGDMCLFRASNECFSDLEIRLVQQVANQCAIALRQSRLYQEIQAQVSDLEQLSHLKDDFLSSVSHELRTPMSNIKMATQMLEIILKQAGVFTSGNRIAQYFKVLQDECQREISLINDLLDLSRIESGDDALTLTTLDLQSWIANLVSAFAHRAKNQNQHLLVEIPATLRLTTDFACMERILTELLQNALKYTPAAETICVGACLAADGLQICVSNTGTEIPASEFDRIFTKFYRIPNNDPWKHGGTGLGLALVKRLTEHLGATIHVESANHQTAFILTFAIA